MEETNNCVTFRKCIFGVIGRGGKIGMSCSCTLEACCGHGGLTGSWDLLEK
jgi:hypothetical protein